MVFNIEDHPYKQKLIYVGQLSSPVQGTGCKDLQAAVPSQ